MPPIEVAILLDPELVSPSAAHSDDLRFWARLVEWSADPRPRLGLRTLQGLHAFAAKGHPVLGLPLAEFWRIVGVLVSRAYEIGRGPRRPCCREHIAEVYSPRFGDQDNVARIVDDICSIDLAQGLAIATDLRCWPSGVGDPACERCAEEPLYLLGTPQASITEMLRSEYLLRNPSDLDGLATSARLLFPGARFSDVAWNRLGTLVGDSADLVRGLVHHLGVLADDVGEIWLEDLTTTGRQQRLAALGVEASPESPQTRGNRRAMRTREFAFEGRQIECSWHTKLRPDTGRVYFAVDGGEVFVGSIVSHLPT